jgi:serine phosphatase RsbU (regulator of sigma subunit)
MSVLQRTVLYPRTYLAISTLLVLLVIAVTAWLANRNYENDRELSLITELGTFAATLDGGTTNSRAMGAAMLFGLENMEAKKVAVGKLPPDAPEVVSALDRLRTLYIFDDVFVVSREGLIAAYSTKYAKHGTGSDVSFRPYVQLAMQGTANVYPAVGSTTDNRGIYLAAPVRAEAKSNSEVIGVTVVKVGADKMDVLLKSWTGGEALLLSPQGVVFAASRDDWKFRLTGKVNEQRIADIKRTRQFGKVFDKLSLPPALPISLNELETDIDGVHYAVRSLAIGWDDPEGDWSMVLLERRTSSWAHKSVQILAGLAGLLAALALLWFYARSRNAIWQRERSLELEAAHEVVRSSIQYASRIQRSILPPDSFFSNIVPDHFVLWEPRDVVGGDVYWCKSWGEGCLIILGDCTGHGVPGAFMTMLSTGVLERVIAVAAPGDVDGLMQHMHQILQSTLNQDGEHGHSDDGIELGVCYLNADKSKMIFSGARFDLYILQNGAVSVIKGSKSGMGYRGISVNQHFATQEIVTNKEMVFYLASDGIVDQIGVDTGWGVGKKRLMQWLVEVGTLPMAEQKRQLCEKFAAYQGSAQRRDDVSVIGFRV